MNLTAEEKELVASTWATATKDVNKTGIALFIRLFTANPEFQELFSFRDVPNFEQLRDDKRLKAHARNVMYTFSMIVNSLDEPDVVQEMVDKIARSHLRRQLSEKHFLALKDVLIELFTDSLGPDIFTKPAQTAWTKMFDFFLAALANQTKVQ